MALMSRAMEGMMVSGHAGAGHGDGLSPMALNMSSMMRPARSPLTSPSLTSSIPACFAAFAGPLYRSEERERRVAGGAFPFRTRSNAG